MPTGQFGLSGNAQAPVLICRVQIPAVSSLMWKMERCETGEESRSVFSSSQKEKPALWLQKPRSAALRKACAPRWKAHAAKNGSYETGQLSPVIPPFVKVRKTLQKHGPFEPPYLLSC